MENSPIEERQDRLGEDLVWGAEGIAIELDISIHRARYLIRKNFLPTTRISERHIVASRRALRKAFRSIAA
jgi:hypothetical protein